MSSNLMVSSATIVEAICDLLLMVLRSLLVYPGLMRRLLMHDLENLSIVFSVDSMRLCFKIAVY